MARCLIVVVLAAILASVFAKIGYVPSEIVDEKVFSPRSHEKWNKNNLPTNFDWRNVNGTNFGTRSMTQMSPGVCGSCWAEAATGALSDRYAIATQGRLRVQLAPQVLLNFNAGTSGGSCNGGDPLLAYNFMHKYGIADDTCSPFLGTNWAHGFEVAAMKSVEDVQGHQCFICMWNGNCSFLKKSRYLLYGVDEYGVVTGEEQMMAEIFARGPIACSVNSEAVSFDMYMGGIIKCPKDGKDPECSNPRTDHVVVIAGWGVDQSTNTKYWVGRNSYGTQWGEGSEGGWFRLERGVNALNVESTRCAWASPSQEHVMRANDRFQNAMP